MKSSAHVQLRASPLRPDGRTGAQQRRTQSWGSDGYTLGRRVAWNPEEVAQKMAKEILFLKLPMNLRKSVYHAPLCPASHFQANSIRDFCPLYTVMWVRGTASHSSSSEGSCLAGHLILPKRAWRRCKILQHRKPCRSSFHTTAMCVQVQKDQGTQGRTIA